MSRLLFEKYNPFRSPSWRFDRVLTLVSARPRPLRASRTDDDRYIRAYRKFLVRIQGRETRESQMPIFEENPALHFAHLIFHNPDKETRSIVQAKILARESDRAIAEYVNTLPDAIAWYAKLFFDVRDRLKSRGYIIKVISGRWDDQTSAPDGSMTEYQKYLCYKLFGYLGGPGILNFVIHGANEGCFPYKSADYPDWFDETWASFTRCRSAMMMKTFPFNKYTVMQLFELHLQLVVMTKQAQLGSGGAPADYRRNVEEMLKSIPWVVGERGFKDKSAIEHTYDVTAVEPRADEALQLAQGTEPQSLKGVRELQMRIASEK